jgi:hypothetical protein
VNLEQRYVLADSVLEAVDRLPTETVLIIASTLTMSRGEMEPLGEVFEAFVTGSPALARLQLAYQLRQLVRDPSLLEHLERLPEEPWRSLASAIRALADEELDALRVP